MLRNFFTALFIFVCAVKLFAAESPIDISAYDTSDSDESDSLSTNWTAEAQIALPPAYFKKGSLDFHQMTNYLCQAAEGGNITAQGFWGFAMVVQSESPDESMAGLQMLQSAAQKGYVPAMYHLGVLYECGRYYVHTNYDEAFHWFGLAATNGSSYGMLQLGACYHYGFGTAPDFVMAAKCYRLAAEETNYAGMKSYGYFLINGIGVEKDIDAAKYWFMRAAKEGGNRRAMYNLGVIYAMKFPDTNAMVEAFRWFQESAELGDAMGCLETAYSYRNGWGVETNLDSYHYWLQQAAARGATDAQYLLGVIYRTGDDVSTNNELSLAWYRKAAAKNHPEANYDLAIYYWADKTNRESRNLAGYYMLKAALGGNREAQFQSALGYYRGDRLPQDCDIGNRWMAKAAENGWAKAEFTLFQLYYNGIPPTPNCPPYPKDKTEALKWLRRAVEHGNPLAESTMAVMLIKGEGMDQNSEEAEKLLRDAAGHGFARAQNDLGFAIMHGDIGSTDWVEAAMWCQLARSHWTNPKTLSLVDANLSNVSSRLTAGQELEVEQRVKNFQAIPVVETDPLVKGWDKNPAYQQEDGKFGH